jgi:Fe/S biogenesis protein NfuA
MITISKPAQKILNQTLDHAGPLIGLRLEITGDTPGAYQPQFVAMQEGDQSSDDIVVECGDLKVYIGPEPAPKAEGLKIDLVPTQLGPRLKFDFPPPEWDDPVAVRLQKLFDERINPGLLNHGGYVGLLNVEAGVAEIIMGGGCQGCALSAQTLSQAVEAIIQQEIPEIHTVIDKTNHARGLNPYYRDADREAMSRSARRRARRKQQGGG